MILTLDIGNTNIKSALFETDEIKDFQVHTSVENVIEYIDHIKFSIAAICSVNPTSEKILISKLKTSVTPIFRATVNQKMNLTINYRTPETLGMDRVCSAVGALDLAVKEKITSENQYIITIDFGTATTINIVSPDRKFIGGLIAPGIWTMLNSLKQNTAQLPLTDLESYQGIIGNSTESSIVSGVITATIGMISETVEKLKNESSKYPIIYVTGGNSKPILHHLSYKVNFEEDLVLKGLKILYDLNK